MLSQIDLFFRFEFDSLDIASRLGVLISDMGFIQDDSQGFHGNACHNASIYGLLIECTNKPSPFVIVGWYLQLPKKRFLLFSSIQKRVSLCHFHGFGSPSFGLRFCINVCDLRQLINTLFVK